MMNIKIDAYTLNTLLPKFSRHACDAIVDLYADYFTETPTVGDLAIIFAEVDAEDLSDYEEQDIIAELPNGCYLVTQ